MQEQQSVRRRTEGSGNGSSERRRENSDVLATRVISWLRPRPVSKTLALAGITLLVLSAFTAHGSTWEAWATAGAAVLGGAIVFRLLWDTGETDNTDSGAVDRFWGGFMESRPVSKGMLLTGALLLMVAGLLRYIDPSGVAWSTVAWVGIILFICALVLRFAWDS